MTEELKALVEALENSPFDHRVYICNDKDCQSIVVYTELSCDI